MTLDLVGMLNAASGHALRTGLFGQVVPYDVIGAPGKGLTCSIGVRDIRPVAARSGLASTSCRVVLEPNIYLPIDTKPAATVDPKVFAAGARLIEAYTGDFDLGIGGGQTAEVDVLGAHGEALFARLGWYRVGNVGYRALTINLPLIVDDCFGQTP